MLIPRLIRRRKRLEEMIGEQLTRAGPFVAIGKPGERLPQLGASRLYVGDSEWQAVVQSYIAQSDLIIVIAGKTHWVQWELANVIRQDRIAGLLIVFPRITEADRNERWQNLKPAFSDTSWSAAMERVDIAGALAVFVAADRGIVVIKSRKANESGLRNGTAGGHLSDAPKAIAGVIFRRHASCSAGCLEGALRPGQAVVLAQRLARIGGAEQSAPLQQRDHLGAEHVEHRRQQRRHDVEAVGRAVA